MSLHILKCYNFRITLASLHTKHRNKFLALITVLGWISKINSFWVCQKMGSLIRLFLEGKKGKHNRQLQWPWNIHHAQQARYQSLPGFPGVQARVPWNKGCFALFLSVLVSETRQMVARRARQPPVEVAHSRTRRGMAPCADTSIAKACLGGCRVPCLFLKDTHPCVRNSSSTGYYHPYGLNMKKIQHPRNQLLIQTWKWIIKLTGNIGPCSPLHFPFIETQLFFGCCQG